MADTRCTERWILYMAWAKSAPDCAEMHKAIYESHLRTCPACRAAIAESYERAKCAEHPAVVE